MEPVAVVSVRHVVVSAVLRVALATVSQDAVGVQTACSLDIYQVPGTNKNTLI